MSKKSDDLPAEEKLLTPQEVFNLSEKPSTRQLIKVFSTTFLVLGVAMGGGEWLSGPVVFARWGMSLFYFTIVVCALQALFNLYCLRYTVLTGEPVIVGLRRIRPYGVWPFIVIFLMFLFIGFPGWVSTAGTAGAFLQLGRPPIDADFWAVTYPWIVALVIIALTVLLIGKKIERTLEIIVGISTVLVFALMIIFVALLLTPEILAETARGVFNVFYIPQNVDWFALGSYIAAAGLAGGLNLLAMDWYRDRGYGMSSQIGYIPGLIGGKKVPLSATGKMPVVTEENKKTLGKWMRLGLLENFFIFFLGGVLGMLLPGWLWRSTLPIGTNVSGFSGAALIAGGITFRFGAACGFLIAFVGLLLLLKSFIGFLDMFNRTISDSVWSVSKRARDWAKGDVRRVYYSILGLYAVWALYATTVAAPLVLLQISFNSINFSTIIVVPLVMLLMRKLPKEFRASRWLETMLVLMVFFYAWVFGNILWAQIRM